MNFPNRHRGNAAIFIVIGLLLVSIVAWYFLSNDKPAAIVDKAEPVDAAIELATEEPTDASPAVVKKVLEKSGDTASCDAQSAWFPHSQTKRTDDKAFASSSNCEFHQWAWQNFLWLTQEVNGEPRFMSFASPESLLGLEREGLLPRMAKSNGPESFDEFLQAGTDGIFVAHNGRAVYYSQYLDDTFVGFIEKNDLTDPAQVRTLIASDPTTTFPIIGTAGAMELKVSWMIVEDGDDVSDMFTTTTQVAKLINKNGKIAVDTSQTEDVTVALVGFHIAGVVEGHPEMIWATFEHKRNAPNVPSGLPLDQPVSDQDFTFYDRGTVLADCNVNYSASDQLVLDEATQTLSPVTQVCRQYEYGNQQGVNQKNDKNIADLNASVNSLLDPSDIWWNYQEVGAIWFKKGEALKPGLTLANDTLLAGSLSLSNSTIETFTQVASTENNCFRCHNTMQELPPQLNLAPLPASNLNISHAFQNIYFWSQENAEANSTSAE